MDCSVAGQSTPAECTAAGPRLALDVHRCVPGERVLHAGVPDGVAVERRARPAPADRREVSGRRRGAGGRRA